MVDDNSTNIAEEFKDYAYRVSHDLSAPVRAMVEFSKLLAAENAERLNSEAREYLDIIIENGKKLQAMMEGLVSYSRLNTMAKPFSKVDTGKVLQDCLTIMDKQINSAGATLEVGELPVLRVDAEQFMQLLLALLDNAIKFHPTGNKPHITISAQKENKMWQFSVSDNGIGVAQKSQQKIFNLFQRLHPDGEYPGTGVGLAIAQKIIQRHGGRIWCESNDGGGASFCFTLGDS